MRLLTFISLVFIGFGCANTKGVTSTASGQLNGTWLPIKQEIGGTTLPKAAFETHKLIISDTTYTYFAESVDKGVVKYNGDKMDIYGKEGINNGKHFTAIYKIENGELIICYNLLGTSYPETFDTKGKPMYLRRGEVLK
jgi:uncharacterized protein (TIGR03067 family)